MSWIQRLYETYQGADRERSEGLIPVAHTTQQAHVEIVIDETGAFLRAQKVPKEKQTTIVPCTEESGGRTGTRPVPHPLSDKLQYVAGDFAARGGQVTSGFKTDPQRPWRDYISNLSDWAHADSQSQTLSAVLSYVRSGHVVDDLIRHGILKTDESGLLLDSPDFPPNPFVRWRVEIPGDKVTETWTDPKLINSWINHYCSTQEVRGFCAVTGMDTALAIQHPARLLPAELNAKLISSNDNDGYTFRGRFHTAAQACTIGYEATQKAHKALQWLIARQGYRHDSQAIVAWSVGGKRVPNLFSNTFALFNPATKPDTESQPTPVEDNVSTVLGDAGQAFARRLNHVIAGYRAELGGHEQIVMMGLNAATPGRMAITFYAELSGSDFLNRIEHWHKALAWPQIIRSSKTQQAITFIGAPSPREIAEAAYGDRVDSKLLRATIERLLPCIVESRTIPRDLVDSAVRRACNRHGLAKSAFDRQLGAACGLFKGHFNEREYRMTLEMDRTSRDYLYGRLLALAEHVESRALWLADERREPTATRYMQRFADRPYSTWRSIELALNPSRNRLRSRQAGFLHAMDTLLDSVMSAFATSDFTDDRRLSGEFLLGYHCQREQLTTRRTESALSDAN